MIEGNVRAGKSTEGAKRPCNRCSTVSGVLKQHLHGRVLDPTGGGFPTHHEESS